MIEILTSPWTIGIGGAIISGIIVYFLSYLIVLRRERKRYKQKVEQANSELVNITRPFTIEKKRFNFEIFSSITASLANKYKVEKEDLFGFKELSNEMISDLTQTPFLEKVSKDEYCNKILEERKTYEMQNRNEDNLYLSKKPVYKTSSKYISFIIALTTCMFAIALTVSIILLGNTSFSLKSLFSNPPLSGILIAGIILIPIFSLLLIQLFTIPRRKRRKKEYKEPVQAKPKPIAPQQRMPQQRAPEPIVKEEIIKDEDIIDEDL